MVFSLSPSNGWGRTFFANKTGLRVLPQTPRSEMRIDAPNYTQVPNILLDEWLNILGHAELKVILFIVRKTIGYHKVRDKISILQIQENTGLTRSNVTSAVKSLINRKLIKKVTSGKNGASSSYYELVISELSNNSDQSCSRTHKRKCS